MNIKFSIYVSPIPDSMVQKEDASQHYWDDLSIFAFPLYSSKAGLVESDSFLRCVQCPGSSTLATKGVIHRSCGTFGGRTS